MKVASSLLLVFVICLSVTAQSNKAFKKLLKENKLEFTQPDDFVEVAVKENGDLFYNFALQYAKDSFEVRYTIMALQPLLEDYEKSLKDTSRTVLDPNKYHKSMFIANILNVSQAGIENLPQTQDFPLDAVNKEFGADNGATAFFTADSEFGEGYDYCLMIMLHIDDRADIYVSFLGNDREMFQEYMLMAFHSVRFE